MATDPTKAQPRQPAEIVASIVQDAGRLVAQHGELLRRELGEGLGGSTTAVATVAAGAGLAAVGGILGSLMLVHGLHRATRLPLWGCYGVVGEALAATGAGLVGAGRRRVAHIDFVPRETLAALREDLQWITKTDETRTT